MGDLRLEDIGAILLGLSIVALALFVGMALIALWPKISLLVRSLWSRYVVFSWDELMERVADDDRSYVNSGHDRSGIEPDRGGIELPVPGMVLPLPDAADTDTRIPISENMSRADLLDILARQRADGRYVFSANKLVELLSNTTHAVSRNVLLEEIAAIRKADSPAPPKRPAQRLERPANGW